MAFVPSGPSLHEAVGAPSTIACLPPKALRIFLRSVADSTHSSEKPQAEQRKRVTITADQRPTGILLPEPCGPKRLAMRVRSFD